MVIYKSAVLGRFKIIDFSNKNGLIFAQIKLLRDNSKVWISAKALKKQLKIGEKLK